MKLNRILFNPAIFAYTLYVKFFDWKRWLPLILLIFLPSFILIVQMTYLRPVLTDEIQKDIVESIKSFFQNPTILMVSAYLFVSDGLVAHKFVADSEPLSLLFTRPVTRFCYVISRFSGTFIGIGILFTLGLTFGLITALCYGIKLHPLSLLDYLTIFANAASYAAFLTFLHCARPVISVVSLIAFMGFKGMAGEYSSYGVSDNKTLELVKQGAILMGNCFGDLLPSTLDLGQMLSESYVDSYAIVIFATNVIIFLFLASFALSKREFSYGAD